MDYPGQGFAKLKYSDSFFSNSWSGQSRLDHTDFASTWLCPEAFHLWIRNSVSPVPKHSELLISHWGDLKSKGHYTYIPSEIFSIAEYSGVGHVQWRCTLTSHLYACMPYQCLHTLWLRGQPTHMAYCDLCSIEAVVLINSLDRKSVV